MIVKDHLEKILDANILKSRVFRWSLVFLWMTIIFLFSHQANSGSITEEYFGIMNVPVRKLGHIVEFMVLYLLVRWALDDIKSSTTTFNTSAALTVAILYAVSDEWHQSFVGGRSASVRDVIIDSIGAISGVFVYIGLAKIKNSIFQNKR